MEASQEKHLSEMQSTQNQIQRMQELIDSQPTHDLSRLQEVSLKYWNHQVEFPFNEACLSFSLAVCLGYVLLSVMGVSRN